MGSGRSCRWSIVCSCTFHRFGALVRSLSCNLRLCVMFSRPFGPYRTTLPGTLLAETIIKWVVLVPFVLVKRRASGDCDGASTRGPDEHSSSISNTMSHVFQELGQNITLPTVCLFDLQFCYQLILLPMLHCAFTVSTVCCNRRRR